MSPSRSASAPLKQSISSRHHPYQVPWPTCLAGACKRKTEYVLGFPPHNGKRYHQIDPGYLRWCINKKVYCRKDRVSFKTALEAHGCLMENTTVDSGLDLRKAKPETEGPSSSSESLGSLVGDEIGKEGYSDGENDDAHNAALELFEQYVVVKKEAATQSSYSSLAVRQPYFQSPGFKMESRMKSEPFTPSTRPNEKGPWIKPEASSSTKTMSNTQKHSQLKPEPSTSIGTPNQNTTQDNTKLISELVRKHNPSDFILYLNPYKDHRVSDVPQKYLQWLIDNTDHATRDLLLAAALAQMNITKSETTPSLPKRKIPQVGWKPPNIRYASSRYKDDYDEKHLWASKQDAMVIFRLTAMEIARFLPRAGKVKYKGSWLFHLWAFVRDHDDERMVDEMLRIFLEKYQRSIEDV